jgi:hypothetical protein
MDYQTSARLFGLPLVHVATGRLVDGVFRRGIAKGWVAIGDVALGVVFGFGGVSVGAVSVGGLAVGALPLGGLALGLAAIGGMAVGALAVGGGAFGWWGASGGLAVAHDFAQGGSAVARHANDEMAGDYFAGHLFFGTATWLLDHALLLVFVPLVAVLVVRLWRRNPTA